MKVFMKNYGVLDDEVEMLFGIEKTTFVGFKQQSTFFGTISTETDNGGAMTITTTESALAGDTSGSKE